MSDSVRPHRRQPTRLLHPWDFPGKSTGVGCHCFLQMYPFQSSYLLQKHGTSQPFRKTEEKKFFLKLFVFHVPFQSWFTCKGILHKVDPWTTQGLGMAPLCAMENLFMLVNLQSAHLPHPWSCIWGFNQPQIVKYMFIGKKHTNKLTGTVQTCVVQGLTIYYKDYI